MRDWSWPLEREAVKFKYKGWPNQVSRVGKCCCGAQWRETMRSSEVKFVLAMELLFSTTFLRRYLAQKQPLGVCGATQRGRRELSTVEHQSAHVTRIRSLHMSLHAEGNINIRPVRMRPVCAQPGGRKPAMLLPASKNHPVQINEGTQ